MLSHLNGKELCGNRTQPDLLANLIDEFDRSQLIGFHVSSFLLGKGLSGGTTGEKKKKSPSNTGDARDTALIPVLERSPGEGNGNPLQYSPLENPMDRGAWQAKSMGLRSQTQLRARACTHTHTHTLLLA